MWLSAKCIKLKLRNPKSEYRLILKNWSKQYQNFKFECSKGFEFLSFDIRICFAFRI